MSHTSQRRGVDRHTANRELIVLAMVPSRYKRDWGVRGAMRELAMTMLKHRPENWLSRNFTRLKVPKLGPAQGVIEFIDKFRPQATPEILVSLAGLMSSVMTAVYTDRDAVARLIAEIKGPWLSRNREKGYPISIVLSGIPDDVRACCTRSGVREHTYLHSIGFYGRVAGLPSEDELSLMTMCGHGLISVHRVRHLTGLIADRHLTPREAAEDIARPCVCGIVNMTRAADIFTRLAAGLGSGSPLTS
ncbi:MAG TPA: hypothetical protein PKH03_08240 [Syntrophales bacterium]|nr:hypothetical protein [Syntrophales bacterium]